MRMDLERIKGWFRSASTGRSTLRLGTERLDPGSERTCELCRTPSRPGVFTGRKEDARGRGWFAYKGFACKRCGFPVSASVAITEIHGYSGTDLKHGQAYTLFKEMERPEKREEYLETLELVCEAIHLLMKEDKFNPMMPEFARMSSPFDEESGIPLWLAQEMRKALAGKGSDLLVRILEAAKAES